MIKHRLLLPIGALFAAFAVLVACGGGVGPASDGPRTVVLATYLTDDLSHDFSQVWVRVLRIAAVDTAQRSVVLYEPSAAEAADPINLSRPSSPTTRFPGLRFRCTTPWPWAWANAPSISRAMRYFWSSVSASAGRSRCTRNAWPETSSATRT